MKQMEIVIGGIDSVLLISIYWLIKKQSTKQNSATGLIEMCPLHPMYKLIVFHVSPNKCDVVEIA